MKTVSLDESTIRQALRTVRDPELDCNIVDLGLVYSVTISESDQSDRAGTKVQVVMTLTTPGCPMDEAIRWGVVNVLLGLQGVDDAEVHLVWDPPWEPRMMSEEGRVATGMA